MLDSIQFCTAEMSLNTHNINTSSTCSYFNLTYYLSLSLTPTDHLNLHGRCPSAISTFYSPFRSKIWFSFTQIYGCKCYFSIYARCIVVNCSIMLNLAAFLMLWGCIPFWFPDLAIPRLWIVDFLFYFICAVIWLKKLSYVLQIVVR